MFAYANCPPPTRLIPSSMGTQLKGSAGRLGRMAASGNKVAILKLSGIIIGTVIVLYYIWRLLF